MNVLMGRLCGANARCFLVDGILTRKRLTNFFRMEWLGLKYKVIPMPNSSSISARLLAPFSHLNHLPPFTIAHKFSNIKQTKNIVKTAIINAYELMRGDSIEAERLMLHRLTQDEALQAHINRLMVSLLMRSGEYAPMITRSKLAIMQASIIKLHQLIWQFRRENNLPQDMDCSNIFDEIDLIKQHIKDAQKAVA
ncbi:MAG: hypothetical protein HRU28_05510 [Rhizobiales bacterium]|nr:hypothetical protein [Hyphomicrobiales bacterium]